MPERIQRRRSAGWRMPPGAIYVGRPTRWGNPFPWRGTWIVWAAVAAGFKAHEAGRKAAAAHFYREWLLGEPAAGPHAGEKSDDLIVNESGVSLSTAEAGRNLAGILATICSDRVSVPPPPSIGRIMAELRGHDLACWCSLDQPRHADVLLELANR